MIPRHLIQTAWSEDLPPVLQLYRRSWRKNNPQLEVRFFSDELCRELIANEFPQHLNAYDSMPFAVMRADVFRYAALFVHGGIYADIDMECLAPLPDWFFAPPCLLSVEASLGRRRQVELRYDKPMQIANCILAAEPNQPFFRALVERAFLLFGRADAMTRDDVEDITGPKMLTRFWFEWTAGGVEVLEPIYLMPPLHYPWRSALGRNMLTRHHNFGSWKARGSAPSLWRRWVERNRFVNPWPSHRFLSQANGREIEPSC